MVLLIIAGLLVVIGLSTELALARLARIGRAILEEQRKANTMLQYLNDREYAKAKEEENVQRSTPNIQRRMPEGKPPPLPAMPANQPDVFRID